MPNYKRKRDSNERAIIDGLVALGCFVIQENNIDLYVKPPHRAEWIPLEVKGERGKLTTYQKNLHATLEHNYGYTIPIVTTLQEAIDAIGLKT